VNASRIVVCLVVGVLVLTPVLVFASQALDDASTAPAKQHILRHHMRSRTTWRNVTATLELGAVRPVLALLGHWLPDERHPRLSAGSSAIFVPPRS
jgi:hypothetical protein